jgi:hypothetical protein
MSRQDKNPKNRIGLASVTPKEGGVAKQDAVGSHRRDGVNFSQRLNSN